MLTKLKLQYKDFFDYFAIWTENRQFFTCVIENNDIIIKYDEKIGADYVAELTELNMIDTLFIYEILLKKTPLIFDNIELPPNLKVYDFPVTIKNYPKETLSDNLFIENELEIQDSPNLHYFGKNTVVGDLVAIKSNLINLDNLKVESKLDVANSKSLTKLPKSLKGIKRKINISYTQIKEIPTCFFDEKLCENLEIIINNLIIENLDNITLNKTEKINLYIKKSELEYDFLKLEKEFDFITQDEIFSRISSDEKEAFIKNVLLCNIKLPLQKKILLEQFDKIDIKEIEQLKDLSSKKMTNKIYFKLINYCRSKEAFEFLYKNGYHFTQEECQTITENSIHNIYEKYLLKLNLNI